MERYSFDVTKSIIPISIGMEASHGTLRTGFYRGVCGDYSPFYYEPTIIGNTAIIRTSAYKFATTVDDVYKKKGEHIIIDPVYLEENTKSRIKGWKDIKDIIEVVPKGKFEHITEDNYETKLYLPNESDTKVNLHVKRIDFCGDINKFGRGISRIETLRQSVKNYDSDPDVRRYYEKLGKSPREISRWGIGDFGENTLAAVTEDGNFYINRNYEKLRRDLAGHYGVSEHVIDKYIKAFHEKTHLAGVKSERELEYLISKIVREIAKEKKVPEGFTPASAYQRRTKYRDLEAIADIAEDRLARVGENYGILSEGMIARLESYYSREADRMCLKGYAKERYVYSKISAMRAKYSRSKDISHRVDSAYKATTERYYRIAYQRALEYATSKGLKGEARARYARQKAKEATEKYKSERKYSKKSDKYGKDSKYEGKKGNYSKNKTKDSRKDKGKKSEGNKSKSKAAKGKSSSKGGKK